MSRFQRALAASVAMAAAACVPFGAQAAGFYVEPAIGYSSIGGVSKSDLDDSMIEVGSEVFDEFTLNDSSLDKNDTGFSLTVGYQFTPNLAVEAAYFDLGKGRYKADATVGDGEETADLTMGFNYKSRGPALALVGVWPLNETVSLDARAGAYFAKTKVSVFASDGETSDSEGLGSESSTSLLLGVGATWSLTERMGLRLGFTRLNKAVADDGDVNRLSLGLRFTF